MDKQLIDYLGNLSRIDLDEKEKELYSKQMSSIFEWMDVLNELDLKDKKEFSEELLKYGYNRQDKPEPFENRKKIIENFSEKEFDFLKVKKVLEG